MDATVDLYNNSYSKSSARVYEDIRRETYGQDLGQTGWMTAQELRSFAGLLELTAEARVLEVGCGAGGCALYLAQAVGAAVTGIDINESGIRNARLLARSAGLEARLHFEQVDASIELPFADEHFDAVFSNDAVCHIPSRAAVLKEWRRVLKPGGRMLFTDALVITGVVSHQEIAARSLVGQYFFLPPHENERLITQAGLHLVSTTDLTEDVEQISSRWLAARESRRESLVRLEGEETFRGLQRFLESVHTLSRERRLSRFSYLASRPADS